MDNDRQMTAQEAHDAEGIRKRAWVNDLHTASLFWELSRDGSVFAKEYDDCECHGKAEFDATGHLNKIEDTWPGGWKWDADTGYYAATEPFEPFTLRAVPETLSHQSLPDAEYMVEQDTKVVWGHRVTWTHHLDGTPPSLEDAMMVGRVLPNGDEEVTKIYPEGLKVELESLRHAEAHNVTMLKPSGERTQ